MTSLTLMYVPLSYSQEDIELMIRQMFISAGPSTAVQPLVTGAQQGTVARGNSLQAHVVLQEATYIQLTQ